MIQDLVRRLAGWMLPGSSPLQSPDPPDALRLVREAASRQMLGPLALAVRSGEIELPEQAEADLRERHRATLWWCLQIESRLLELRERFDAAGGIEHLVIKGSAVAHLDEADPSLRSFADLDLLVRGADIDQVVAVLAEMGATRPWAERRPGYDRRFAKSVTMTCDDGVEIDLHRSLCDGVHGFRIPRDRIFDRRTSFELGGVSVDAPCSVHRFLHAAYHAVLGSPAPKLSSLRDLGGYMARPDLPVQEVVAEAERWRGAPVLAVAVAETIDTLSLDLPQWSAWATSLQPSTRESRIVRRQRREGSSLGWGKVSALREVEGFGDRIAYGVGLGFPTHEHLRSRNMRRLDLLVPRNKRRRDRSV